MNLPVLNLPSDISTHVTGYCTSIPPKMEDARRYNLFIKKPVFPAAPLTVTKDKLKYLTKVNADLLIDDKESTVREINSAYERGETSCRALKYCPYYLDEEETLWDLHDLSKVKEKLKELKWID